MNLEMNEGINLEINEEMNIQMNISDGWIGWIIEDNDSSVYIFTKKKNIGNW